MPQITLPDQSKRQFDNAVTVAEVAANIGAGLAKAALAGKVDGRLVDTSYQIKDDAELAIITDKTPEGLDVIRHSTAHLLAHAVKELFPTAQVTIGPVIEDGFYYDFSYERPFTPEDLICLEEKMHELAANDIKVVRSTLSREEAIKYFRELGEEYKAQIIESIPAGETLSLYNQGAFTDLCRGPHVPSTAHLKAFKLTKLAGAYWRGDSNNEMLQRIYGTAWANKKDLEAYLTRIEEAEKRDHRKIAKKMDLFHIQPESPGMVFWHPNGWAIFQTIAKYMRQKQKEYGYQEVNTPIMADYSLWASSGHAEKFGNDMFSTESENRKYAVKPMSCPMHIQIFKQGLKSYRDLPLRLAEFGCCHRNEASGALHGLMRVRGFNQDDGHIFCTEGQIQDEAARFIDMLYDVYLDFGFTDVILKLSTRPEKRFGSDASWDKAEKALADAMDMKGLKWEYNPGEGAFYGPKIEFSLKDCIGRVWQCGTLQVDFVLPERLDTSYVDDKGEKVRPVMLHRAIFGSFERFIGILLENYADGLPIWLAPIQVTVMNITDKQDAYCLEIQKILQGDDFRVNLDLRNEKIGYKIREHSMARIPYLVVVGEREMETRTVSVRTHAGVDLGNMSLHQFQERLQREVAHHGNE
ncbi:MAG: threonine--tRNA ligase [Gammaproteobacteria bacterium]|nr:threonine--tRNA ligase [Gammaproteobacteria bacterium]